MELRQTYMKPGPIKNVKCVGMRLAIEYCSNRDGVGSESMRIFSKLLVRD